MQTDLIVNHLDEVFTILSRWRSKTFCHLIALKVGLIALILEKLRRIECQSILQQFRHRLRKIMNLCTAFQDFKEVEPF